MTELDLTDGLTRFTLVAGEAEDPRFVSVRVTAQTPWLRAELDERLEREELSALAAALRKLHADMAGAHVFQTRQNWLELTIAMAKRGDLHVSIRLQSAPDYLNEVRLFLNLAQGQLPTLAERIEDMGR
jgi:hypothetical protein